MCADTHLRSRFSTIAGSLGAILIIVSAPIHSLVGWPDLRSQLTGVNAPADLILGLQVGWHFAGAAMGALGFIVLHQFQSRPRGTHVPAWTVAVLYLFFGAIALVVTGFDPFFLVFIIPGALVLLGVLT